MLLQLNCARNAGALSAFVFATFLSQGPNAWATSSSGADIPVTQSRPHQLSIAKEIVLANDYLFGRGVPQDSKMSAFWLEKAANAGDPEAQMEMGYFCETGIGVEKNLERAAHWYQLAAHGGLPDAKSSLGMLYFWGTGVPENKETAAQLFREAAEKGIGIAAYQLGSMYSLGIGVPQDKSIAEQWFVKGAKQHNPQAQYRVALFFFDGAEHKADVHKAEGLLRSSAASGFVPAMYSLGLLLSRHPDLAKSSGEAAQFLEDAANAGIWKSSVVLGRLARDGDGVPRDDKAAYFHFRVAALQGGNDAQKNVESDLQRLTETLAPALVNALDVEAAAWYQKHNLTLEFAYKNDGQGAYHVSALASPKDGQHELQLLPMLPDDASANRRTETAGVIVK